MTFGCSCGDTARGALGLTLATLIARSLLPPLVSIFLLGFSFSHTLGFNYWDTGHGLLEFDFFRYFSTARGFQFGALVVNLLSYQTCAFDSFPLVSSALIPSLGSRFCPWFHFLSYCPWMQLLGHALRRPCVSKPNVVLYVLSPQGCNRPFPLKTREVVVGMGRCTPEIIIFYDKGKQAFTPERHPNSLAICC